MTPAMSVMIREYVSVLCLTCRQSYVILLFIVRSEMSLFSVRMLRSLQGVFPGATEGWFLGVQV